MTEKLQCSRCGSRRQRNLQVNVHGVCLCKRCALNFSLPEGAVKRYRYASGGQIGDVHADDDPRYDSKEFIEKKEWQRKQSHRIRYGAHSSDHADDHHTYQWKKDNPRGRSTRIRQ